MRRKSKIERESRSKLQNASEENIPAKRADFLN